MTQIIINDTLSYQNYKDNLSDTSGQSGDNIENLERSNKLEKTTSNIVHEVFNAKMKSSLCRNFVQKGVCPYGEKCQFAHGSHQLKCNNQQMAYKTRTCHSFIRKDYCLYGYRCNFLHPQKDSENQTINIFIRQPLYQSRKKSTSRLLELLSQ